MTYNGMIRYFEKQAINKNLEEHAIKWLFFYSDFFVGYDNLDKQVDPKIYEKFNAMMELYLEKQVPPQYILNKTYFYGYEYYVDNNVFIPRNETEQLVEETIYRIDENFDLPITICDICCGSGAIGITLKKEIEDAKVYLCDISDKALEIVKRNAKSLDADVNILQGDFIAPLLENKLTFDVIVCNPPYIKNKEKLASMVVDNEPNIALFGGIDGLDFYRELFKNFDKLTNPKCLVALEFGYDQKESLEKLLKEMLPNYRYEFLKDYASLDRMLFIYKGF